MIKKLSLDSKLISLFFKMSNAFLIKTGSAGLSFLMFVLLARVMGQQSYGIFAAAFSSATFLAVCGGFGQQTLIHRFGGLYIAKGKQNLLIGLIKNGYLLVAFGCFLISFIYFLWATLNYENSNINLIIGTCFLAVSIGLVEYQARVAILISNVSVALMPRDIIWRFVIVILTLIAIFSNKTIIFASNWIWILAFTLFAILFFQIYWMRSNGDQKIFFTKSEKYERPIWLRAMWGLWFVAIITRSTGALSVVIAENMLGPNSAAPYFAALRTSQLLTLFQIAATIIVTPMISREIGNNNEAAVKRVCSFVACISGGAALIGLLLFYLLGSNILNLFGIGFDVAIVPMLILSCGYAASCLLGPIQPLLQMKGHDRSLLIMLVFSNGISLAIMPLAIRYGGIEGASLALVLGLSGWSILGWIYSRKILRIDPSIFGILNVFRFFR